MERERLRVLFALPGFHGVDRGAEVALLAVAQELAELGVHVSVFGSGSERAGCKYDFKHVGSIPRTYFESMPSIPSLRNETAYEDLTFSISLLRYFVPTSFDITVTCNYPFTNWVLRRPVLSGGRPRHVFVTQNGDWPAISKTREYRFFGCDGLVCTNPEFFQRNRTRWNSVLIPNGVDTTRFRAGPSLQSKFKLPEGVPIILMVSALIESKRVLEGIEAAARIDGAHLVVAGSGPLRDAVMACANRLMPGRFSLVSVPPEDMPGLYNSANAFLHLSLEESFGNVYVEAMATGLPIVAHDSERVRWIVGAEEQLVDSNHSDAITAALRIAIQMPRRSSASVEEKISRFTWRNIAKSYLAFFESSVLGHRGEVE